MSVITYTAIRELAPGTSPSEVVTREFRLISRRRGQNPIGKRNTAIGGANESVLFRREIRYACTTELIEPRSLLEQQLNEFFASVSNGEQFNFDRYGSLNIPDNPVSCIMLSTSFAEGEQGKTFHRYGFSIREK